MNKKEIRGNLILNLSDDMLKSKNYEDVMERLVSLIKSIEERAKKEKHTGKIKGYKDYKFNNIDCMIDIETKSELGFYKSENDVRPSSATYIEKEKAIILYKLFIKDFIINWYNEIEKELKENKENKYLKAILYRFQKKYKEVRTLESEE